MYMYSHNNNNNNNNNKNQEMTTMGSTCTDENVDEFEIVKDYLMRCPHLSSARDSPAIKAAIEGIEKEQQRRVRDAKLRCKFGGKRNASAVTTDDYTDRDEIVVVDKDDIDVTVTNARMMDTEEEDDDDKEWQDVPQKDDGFSSGSNIDHSYELEGGSSSGGISFLGKELAKACVDAIAEQQQRNNVVVSSPIAAIALALHAALRSDILGFRTQNILPQKESSSKKRGGLAFAPPIRELNKNQFLPYGWDDIRYSSSGNTNTTDKRNNAVSLRYRKMDMGAMILTVESVDEEGDCNDSNNIPGTTKKNVQVTLVPANSKDSTPVHVLSFPISEHINLDSWNAATLKTVGSKTSDKKECKIAPTLHYKNLSGLMSKFCRTFDLGTVSNMIDDADTLVTAALGTTSNKDPILKQPTSDTHYSAVASVEHYPNRRSEGERAIAPEMGRVPSTFDQAFPGRNPIHSGDFAGDILPAAGLHDPRFHTGRGNSEGQRIGGNLMGPNHPMFSPGGGGHGQMIGGRGGGGVAFGGPGTMQPRFDPVYPPGVLDDDNLRYGPAAGRRLHNKIPSRSSTGEPNPDHLPPPNSLGGIGNNNHMFM
jgi:hypothetical protein